MAAANILPAKRIPAIAQATTCNRKRHFMRKVGLPDAKAAQQTPAKYCTFHLQSKSAINKTTCKEFYLQMNHTA